MVKRKRSRRRNNPFAIASARCRDAGFTGSAHRRCVSKRAEGINRSLGIKHHKQRKRKHRRKR